MRVFLFLLLLSVLVAPVSAQFEPEPPVPFDISMSEPVMPIENTTLPTVTPVEIADVASLNFVDYDWDTFVSNYFLVSPDPATLFMPETYQGDLPSVPVNLSDVRFVQDADLTDTQLGLLAQNGFVVVPSDYQQFDAAYSDDWSHLEGKGDFITTDVMLHSFFLAYQNLLMFFEMERFYGDVSYFTGIGFLNAQVTWRQLAGTPLESNARNAAVYYAVPLLMLSEAEDDYVVAFDGSSRFGNNQPPSEIASQMDEGIRADAQAIIDLIMAGEGQLEMPVLGGLEDFSQYQPRSYYAGSSLLEAYFRAMMWLGRITFRANNPSETLTSLFVMDALTQDDLALERYRAIGDALDFLVGPMDDLSIKDVLPPANAAFGDSLDAALFGDEALFAQYRDAINQLPAPRVNSIPLEAGELTPEQLEESTRGFRLFGQRFTFDGYAMQQLIYPEVGTGEMSRSLPLGLDIPAVFGSNVAYALADEAGATGFENYTEQVTALREEVNGISAESWLENLNGGWLWMLQPLASRDAAVTPPLMQTEAWMRKDISTFLGSWTELKHATLLYAEQPLGGGGGGGMPPEVISYSFVEPNPQVFARIAVLSAILHDGLIERGLINVTQFGATNSLINSLENIGGLSSWLAEAARKELAGEPLSEDDYYFLQEQIGSVLGGIRIYIEQWLSDPPDDTSLVADVASNTVTSQALHVAIANPDLIYVVTNSPYGLTVTRGAVYSYYEFVNPIDQRMNDDEWRELVAAGETPLRPEWTALYLGE